MTGIKLHGYPVSNYVNVVRAALIEKALPHSFVLRRAAQDEAFLAMNPMGKIPVLQDGDFHLGETVAILEYLDDRYPERSLRPAELLACARGRQIVNIIQAYVEAPARGLFAGVFMGGRNPPDTTDQARATLDRSTAALRRLMSPTPYLFGERPTQADLFAFYHLDLVERLTRFVWNRSIIGEIGVPGWHQAMAARASSRTVLGDFEPSFAAYLADKGAAYVAPAVGSPVDA